MIQDIFKLDSRIQITLTDLKKCMDIVLAIMKTTKNSKVKICHPGIKKSKNLATVFIEFNIDLKNKNIKLASDVAIVLKY